MALTASSGILLSEIPAKTKKPGAPGAPLADAWGGLQGAHLQRGHPLSTWRRSACPSPRRKPLQNWTPAAVPPGFKETGRVLGWCMAPCVSAPCLDFTWIASQSFHMLLKVFPTHHKEFSNTGSTFAAVEGNMVFMGLFHICLGERVFIRDPTPKSQISPPSVKKSNQQIPPLLQPYTPALFGGGLG